LLLAVAVVARFTVAVVVVVAIEILLLVKPLALIHLLKVRCH
jgi:hypothetical protein